MLQRYSFSTQKPDRDSEGDYVKYKDLKELELTIRTALAALEMAWDDMAEWRQLARRQHDEMPHNAPLCPTAAGIEKSEERNRIVARAIRLCRETIQTDDKSKSRQTA